MKGNNFNLHLFVCLPDPAHHKQGQLLKESINEQILSFTNDQGSKNKLTELLPLKVYPFTLS